MVVAPDAAYFRRLFQHDAVHARLLQPDGSTDPGKACAHDDDGVVFRAFFIAFHAS